MPSVYPADFYIRWPTTIKFFIRGASTVIYRVLAHRDLESNVNVSSGETSYAGKLSTDTQPPNSPFGFIVNWDHQPTTQAAICQAFNQAYTLTDSCKPPEQNNAFPDR